MGGCSGFGVIHLSDMERIAADSGAGVSLVDHLDWKRAARILMASCPRFSFDFAQNRPGSMPRATSCSKVQRSDRQLRGCLAVEVDR